MGKLRVSSFPFLSEDAKWGDADFVIQEPTTGVQWANGQTNLIKWTKGLDDGIDTFDIEMQQLGMDGLSFIARQVPATTNSLNVYISGIPTGDDYVIMFVNSSPGYLYTNSAVFAIANSTNSSSPSPDPSAPTVSLTATPNPTAAWATTFPASTNGVLSWRLAEGSHAQAVSIFATMAVCIFAGVLVVL
ncbi:hypothetical protein B0H21DRAFT_780171 [Amylocystis lapponica]|nr:hypothetical protein B0H21DRAFT_780171 [Amylocystis lapponica]